MSFEMTAVCDARGCSATIDIDDYENPGQTIRRKGWHDDPNYVGQHYCNHCWPKVKAELEEDQ